MNVTPTASPLRLATPIVALLVALALVACQEDPPLHVAGPASATPTPPVTASPASTPLPAAATPSATRPAAPSSTPTATASATAVAPRDPEARVRDLLRSALAARVEGGAPSVLDQIEVLSEPVDAPDRTLWAAVSSGPAIHELDAGGARHLLGVYERRADQSFVEVAQIALASEPTLASLDVLPVRGEGGYPIWIGVHGTTGVHSGTFELLRFDGFELASSLWWFSPSPHAALVEDLDGDTVPEIVLDASDPYVFCYACGVELSAEVIYRWQDGEPVAVNITPVGAPVAAALTAEAVAYVQADLWRAARDAAQRAASAAPGDADVAWLRIAIERTAEARLAQAGGEAQPLVTNVIAGEYRAALALMREREPRDLFDPAGPMIAGTVAADWPATAGELLVSFASRALEVQPQRAEAYAVRALGRMLADPAARTDAYADMERAAALQPAEPLYRAAANFLREGPLAGGAAD